MVIREPSEVVQNCSKQDQQRAKKRSGVAGGTPRELLGPSLVEHMTSENALRPLLSSISRVSVRAAEKPTQAACSTLSPSVHARGQCLMCATRRQPDRRWDGPAPPA